MEVTRASRVRKSDLATLRIFQSDYPVARCVLLYSGHREYEVEGIRVLPLESALPGLARILEQGKRSTNPVLSAARR
jgi:hypothetical protein